MSESHAKLSLRTSVRVPDAVAAVNIFDDNVRRRRGFSFVATAEQDRKKVSGVLCASMFYLKAMLFFRTTVKR